MGQLDQEMNEILQSNAPSDVKLKLYNHILRQHGEVGEQMKKPQKVAFVTEKRQPKPKTELPKQRLLSGLPPTKVEFAKKLIDHLESGNVEFNTNNELVLNGDRVEGSNVVDLFDYTTRDRQKTPPIGWNQFKKKLADTNVPRGAIGNRNVKIGDQEDGATTRPPRFNALYK
ncbi:MAG: hypothetical protein GY821_01895 [Gammaproteobacteria bacterium]|nr:hypothetical protein [Gammaproteobacteria bacterium]